MQSVSILISGRVQGVFFRKYALTSALNYGLSGFVMNTREGNVYIEATGNADKIAELIKWCHTGSPLSSVKQVTVNTIPVKHSDGFTIRH